MFKLVTGLPSYVVGVVMKDQVTAQDFKDVLEPALRKASMEWKGINLLLIVETEMKNFTPGAWLHDLKVNLRYFLKWNKVALVDHSEILQKATTTFDLLAPAEARTFSVSQLEEAKKWVSAP